MHATGIRATVLVLSALLCGAASAQQGNAARDKRWEFSLQMHNIEGKNHSFESGSTAQTKGTLGFGFGFAYNVSPHLNIGMDFSWANIDYDAVIQPAIGSGQTSFATRGSMDSSTYMFNATWNILSGPLTPYLAGGIGGVYIDTNIQTGPAVPVCWYYPWYGYYCGTAVPTASNNYFAYSGSGGLRWDVSREVFLRGGVTRQWIDASGYSGDSGNTIWRIDIGFKN